MKPWMTLALLSSMGLLLFAWTRRRPQPMSVELSPERLAMLNRHSPSE
jgi:hypothetical protein